MIYIITSESYQAPGGSGLGCSLAAECAITIHTSAQRTFKLSLIHCNELSGINSFTAPLKQCNSNKEKNSVTVGTVGGRAEQRSL